MSVDVIMPKLGESITEGTILEWKKSIGDTIAKDETLLEISTGKPYIAPNHGTQVIDRTGQMVIDEVNGNHGFIFSRQISSIAPYGFNWPAELEEGHKAGHPGRHM